jgi:hypothetical protein
MFEFLHALNLHPRDFAQAAADTGHPSPYVGQILRTAFDTAQGVVVLLTPDDEARLRPTFRNPSDPGHETELTPQARPNVLFEAGMAMAWDEFRTVLVELGQCRPFSDIGGRHVLRIDDTTVRRQQLAQRLEKAGLLVDTTGTEWHTAGKFDQAVSEAAQQVASAPAAAADNTASVEPIAENVKPSRAYTPYFYSRKDLSKKE